MRQFDTARYATVPQCNSAAVPQLQQFQRFQSLNSHQCGEMRDSDERREVCGVRDLQRADEGRQTLGAKPERLPLDADRLGKKTRPLSQLCRGAVAQSVERPSKVQVWCNSNDMMGGSNPGAAA